MAVTHQGHSLCSASRDRLHLKYGRRAGHNGLHFRNVAALAARRLWFKQKRYKRVPWRRPRSHSRVTPSADGALTPPVSAANHAKPMRDFYQTWLFLA